MPTGKNESPSYGDLSKGKVMDSYRKSARRMTELHRQLEAGEKVSDEEILDVFDKYSGQAFGCEPVAVSYLEVIPHVLYFRPHLAPKLVWHFIDPLYALGCPDASSLLKWIAWFVRSHEGRDKVSEKGRKYLIESLPGETEIIEACMQRIDEELEELRKKGEAFEKSRRSWWRFCD